jgi:tRNA(Ile)-lysidine synthase
MKRPAAIPALRKKAARLAEIVPLAQLHPAPLAEALTRRGPWVVALSGGADSVALLLLLWAHFPEQRAKLRVLHFDHRLRGRASTADAKFCARLAASLGVPILVGEWRRRRAAHTTEADARKARHEFFAREMKRLGARVLWLAHQQDDIAETLLMRLARGSGTAGLAAPRPVHAHADGRIHLRPLLTLSKKRIVVALLAAGVPWREDATNQSDAFFRNRVRRALIPAWKRAAERDVLAGAALSRERLHEDDAALEAWLAELKPFAQRGRAIRLEALSGKPLALWRRALHRWLLVVEPDTDLSRAGFEQLLAVVHRGRATRFSLGSRDFAVVERGMLRLKCK